MTYLLTHSLTDILKARDASASKKGRGNSVAWVRCASGNAYLNMLVVVFFLHFCVGFVNICTVLEIQISNEHVAM